MLGNEQPENRFGLTEEQIYLLVKALSIASDTGLLIPDEMALSVVTIDNFTELLNPPAFPEVTSLTNELKKLDEEMA